MNSDQRDEAKELYRIGIHRDVISKKCNLSIAKIKYSAMRKGWKRDPESFQLGADFMAAHGEIFLPFHECPEYFVSSNGRVLSMKASSPGIVLKPDSDKDGYLHVSLKIPGRETSKRYSVHRMVLTTFNGKPPTAGHVCAHWDGDRTNNCLENLRWATQSDNLKDKHRHGTAFVGSAHPRASIDEQKAAEIKKLLQTGLTLKDVARASGSTFYVVADISSGRSWRHVQ